MKHYVVKFDVAVIVAAKDPSSAKYDAKLKLLPCYYCGGEGKLHEVNVCENVIFVCVKCEKCGQQKEADYDNDWMNERVIYVHSLSGFQSKGE